MLWNGYREKHEAKFLLQGPGSTISTALTLEEHTIWFSRVDKSRGKGDHSSTFIMLPKCKSGATTHHILTNRSPEQMNTESGEISYAVSLRPPCTKALSFFHQETKKLFLPRTGGGHKKPVMLLWLWCRLWVLSVRSESFLSACSRASFYHPSWSPSPTRYFCLSQFSSLRTENRCFKHFFFFLRMYSISFIFPGWT